MIDPNTLYRIDGVHPADHLLWRKGSGPTLEIYDLHIGAERRRQGVGRHLVNVLLGHARRWLPGCTLVWAVTRADNWIAQQFYEEMGFRVVGVLRQFYGDVPDALPADTVDAILYGRKPG